MERSATPPGAPHDAARPQQGWGRQLLRFVVGAYLLSVIALWLWMIGDGDRGWMATLVLFGPRWICALPLPLLVVLAATFERKLLAPLAVAAIVILFGLMDFEINLPRRHRGGLTLRVISCNVERAAIRPELIAELIEQTRPDVVALQEYAHGTAFVWPADWHMLERDEFILASRYPITEQGQFSRPGRRYQYAAVHYTVELPDRQINLFNLHLESPRVGLEAVLSRRVGIDFSRADELTAVIRKRALESKLTREWIAGFEGPKVMLGDFNLPPGSRMFRSDWSGFDDAFAQAGFGFGFTKISEKDGWSYGARIDHVLTDGSWRALRSWVGDNVGSDHMPLMAEVELKP